MTLPDKLIEKTLNAKARREERGVTLHGIPAIHLSSLIKAGTADQFCAREFVLRYFERRDKEGAGVPVKFELLWATGHFLGDYIVKKFIQRNKDYNKYVWGDWECLCKKTKVYKQHKPDVKCQHCQTPLDNYVETDLHDPSKLITGHADLIFFKDNVFYVYEFKSISRADIDFNTMKEPLGDHLLQASSYAYMLKSMYPESKVSPTIRFVYVDRSMNDLYSGNPYKELTALKVEAWRIRKIYEKAKITRECIISKTLPDRVCKSVDCGRAKICNVTISCFNRREKEVDSTPLDLIPRYRRSESISGRSKRKKRNGMDSQSKLKKRVKLTPKE